MKPAFSVLIFTVSSGAGYGLLIWLLVMYLAGVSAVSGIGLIAGGIAGLVLVTIGLLSSTLHLANPKNAWRAFSRFRTSWLSREGVFAVLFYPVILAFGAALWMNDMQATMLSATLAVAAILLALATVVCTGMIYASLKPIRQWHNPLTTPLYILFSLMSGVLLICLLQLAIRGQVSDLLLGCFVASLLLSAVLKLSYFWLIGRPQGATINTATGFSQASVRLLDAGHNAGNFLTSEFIFDTAADKLMRLRTLMLLFTFLLPLLIVGVTLGFRHYALLYALPFTVFAGLLLERWLFFAEARHVVRLYHGEQRT